MDDEAFLIFAVTGAGINKSGKMITIEKVRPILLRKPILRKNVAKSFTTKFLNLPTGQISVNVSTFPNERGDKFLSRITKGFLRHFYPEYDYSNDKFEIYCLAPTPQHIKVVTGLMAVLRYESRGDDVIRIWHGIVQEGGAGSWIFCFYDCAWFIVIHKNNALYQNGDWATWGLPSGL